MWSTISYFSLKNQAKPTSYYGCWIFFLYIFDIENEYLSVHLNVHIIDKCKIIHIKANILDTR